MKATDSVKTAIGSGSEKAGTTISSKKTSHPEMVHFVSVSHSPVAAIRLEHQVPVRKSVKPSNLRNIGLHPLISPCAIFVDKITVFSRPISSPSAMTPDTTSKFGKHKPNKFLSGLISFAQSAPRNWAGKQMAQLIRKIVLFSSTAPIDITIGEIHMRCHLRDNNSEYKFAFMPWRFDELEREYLVKHLPADGTFVDIGANVGIYSLFVATHLSSSGRIIAMEPNPPAYGRLAFNISSTQAGRKEWPKVELLPIAVADVNQEIDLHLDAKNLGSSSVKNSAQSVGVVRVKCKPLAEILESLCIQKVDAIKIDIEGAEDLALAPYLDSASDESLPHCIVMENSQHLWKLDLVGLLKKRGYRAAITTRMNTVYSRSA